jgi:hypothetical protein
MRTFCLLLGTGLLATVAARGQDVAFPGGSDYPNPVVAQAVYCAQAAYQASVIYTAPVVYEAPVVYQAPVIYTAPVYYAQPVGCQASTAYCPPASTVTFIGGGQACTRNYTADCDSSVQVIGFGCGQARQQGYQFSSAR